MNSEQISQRQPRPPSIPQSQSSMMSQRTPRKGSCLKNGRRVINRCSSMPDVRHPSDLKLPKTTSNFSRHCARYANSCVSTSFGAGKNPAFSGVKKRTDCNSFTRQTFSDFKANTKGIKETVTKKQKLPSSQHKGESMNSKNEKVQKSSILSESVFDLNENPDFLECGKCSTPNRHAVFTFNSEDGRLQAISNVLPVAGDTGHQQHVISQSPWHYYGNGSKYQVVDELFDSDDEGLIVNHGERVGSGLDPIKTAMIKTWIQDVTRNSSKPNKE